jgi:hypothetical protein
MHIFMVQFHFSYNKVFMSQNQQHAVNQNDF